MFFIINSEGLVVATATSAEEVYKKLRELVEGGERGLSVIAR